MPPAQNQNQNKCLSYSVYLVSFSIHILRAKSQFEQIFIKRRPACCITRGVLEHLYVISLSGVLENVVFKIMKFCKSEKQSRLVIIVCQVLHPKCSVSIYLPHMMYTCVEVSTDIINAVSR